MPFGAVTLVAMFAASMSPEAPGAVASAALAGEWLVDLSGNPEQPYIKPMVLALAADGSVSGSFYENPIQAGRWKSDRGRTCVSFNTSDGAGPYFTSACLVGKEVQGQTWAEHRKFVFNWNAVRK